jgi:hypothetical protein
MKRKTIELLVTYKFKVSYEHAEHLRNIKKELKMHPITDMCGAGVATDNVVYGYSCKLIKAAPNAEITGSALLRSQS